MFSFSWSEKGGISLSIDSAQARVGRPLSPVSVAGVPRRQTRRAVYGAAVVGAAAIGTAAAVAATSPYVGWGADPYAEAGYHADRPYAAYAYSPEEYRRRNGMVCEPGTLTKMDDGRTYHCQ